MPEQPPLTQQEITLWQKRLDTISNLSAIFRRRYTLNDPNRSWPNQTGTWQDREETIDRILNDLEKFGNQQFNFFCNGFRRVGIDLQVVIPATRESDGTPQYAMSTILNQLADDLVVLQRALEQRIIPLLKGNERQIDEITKTMDTADKLAWAAKKMFDRVPYLAEKSTVLSYLHKAPNVRIIPYSPVAMIGIPVSCVAYDVSHPLSRDFLSIPHEFGHHLYWYGKNIQSTNESRFIREALHKAIGDIPTWLDNWIEEIFADVICCLIGGPVVALSIQDLVLEERLNQFDVDYERHPLPILRPFIYTETLKLRNDGSRDIANKLEGHWNRRLAERKLPIQTASESKNWQFNLISSKQASQRRDAQFPPARIEFSQIIEVIKAILHFFPTETLDTTLRWSYGQNIQDDVEQLYQEFQQRLPAIIQATAHDNLNSSWPDKTWQELVEELEIINENSEMAPMPSGWQAYFGQAAQSSYQPDGVASDPAALQVAPAHWLSLLAFRGWTTEGPGSPRGQGGS